MDRLTTRTLHYLALLWVCVPVGLSYLESWFNRFDVWVRKHFGPTLLDLPPSCPFCGRELGMARSRARREVRMPSGEMKELPPEILRWQRCSCERYQRGERVVEADW